MLGFGKYTLSIDCSHGKLSAATKSVYFISRDI